MAVSYKGAISFGLVHIPVALYTATQDKDIHFNQLCKSDHSRIRYKKVCASCGKEIGPKDIVKGYEYDDGKYVVVTNDDRFTDAASWTESMLPWWMASLNFQRFRGAA